MSTVAVQRDFIENAVGKYFDPDGMYKYQCKDVIDAYCIALWGDWKTTITPGNANQVFATASEKYFEKIRNVPGDLTNFPRYGDVVCSSGDKVNPYGHIWICKTADAYTMGVIHQNVGGYANTPTEYGVLGYSAPGIGDVIGWLRPKVSGAAPAPAPAPTGGLLNVIDISQHQAGIQLSGLTAQAVFVKASEGAGGWTDPRFAEHVTKVRNAKLPLGLYHFARPNADPGNTAEAEAASFVSVVKNVLKPGDVIALDWEKDDTSDAGWAKRWLTIVEKELGRRPLLYSYQNLILSGKLDSLKDYPLWLAVYPSNAHQSWGPVTAKPKAPGWNVVMWQYSQTGRLPGYGSDLDLNVFYGGLDAWAQLGGTGGVPVAKPGPVLPVSVSQCVVEAGDTLTSIAAQFKVSVEGMVHANPGLNPDLIYPGQVLNIPGGTVQSKPVVQAGVQKVIVERGDSLSAIAAQFGVNLQELIRVNKVTNANVIHPGQVLTLPGKAKAPAPAPKPKPKQCVVEAGDTLSGIALQFGVPLPQLVRANPGIDPNVIFPGQVLNLS